MGFLAKWFRRSNRPVPADVAVRHPREKVLPAVSTRIRPIPSAQMSGAASAATAQANPGPWFIGKTVGEMFEIRGVLGRGGMGIVYLAYDKATQKNVAVKLPVGRFVEDEAARKRFAREAEAWTELIHPHIVHAFDVKDDQTTDYRPAIFMDYCDGGSLAARLERGRVPLAEALDIAIQICWGMEFAHLKGKVHRDLKPGNVLLTKDGKALADHPAAPHREFAAGRCGWGPGLAGRSRRGERLRQADGQLPAPGRELFERLSALPGVQAVGAATYLPPDSTGRYSEDASIEGEPSKWGLYIQVITPNYFRALGIPLVKGRGLTEQDAEGSVPVAVVNETFVRRLLGGADPIGRQLLNGASIHDRHTIVGVVRDVPNRTLKGEIEPEAYFSYRQEPFWTRHLVVRTESAPMGLVASVREIMRSAERSRPVLSIQTMEDRLAGSITPQRFQTTLITLFSAVGLTLAAVGIYGVVSYSVTQRVREFGIRMTVGAQRGDILRLVTRQALWLLAAGLGLGLCGALALTRVLKSFLFQVGTMDTATFVVVSVFLAGVALFASYVPARRAAKVDPMEALRYE